MISSLIGNAQFLRSSDMDSKCDLPIVVSSNLKLSKNLILREAYDSLFLISPSASLSLQ